MFWIATSQIDYTQAWPYSLSRRHRDQIKQPDLDQVKTTPHHWYVELNDNKLTLVGISEAIVSCLGGQKFILRRFIYYVRTPYFIVIKNTV